MGWLQPPFSKEALAEAKAMGIDLEDAEVQAQLRAFHVERQKPGARYRHHTATSQPSVPAAMCGRMLRCVGIVRMMPDMSMCAFSGVSSGCRQHAGGAGAGAAARRGASKGARNPKTFLEWWQLLLAGRLRWRWHYLCYIALWLHALWRVVRIIGATQSGESAGARVQNVAVHDDF